MTKIFGRILGNITGVYASVWLVPGFMISGGNRNFIIAGTLLGLLNLTVKPILKAFTFPLIIISLGLFLIVINSLILWLTAYLFPSIIIAGPTALILAAVIISIVNLIVSVGIKII